MKTTIEIQRMALAAATAVVGRRRHRAGVAAMGLLLSSGALACGTLGGGEVTASESSGEVSEVTGEGSTSLSTTTLADAGGTSEGSSEGGELTGSTSASGSSSAGESTGDPTVGESTGEPAGTDTGPMLEDCVLASGEVDWECCEAQGWEPAEHCTPWGPPAPPRFDRARMQGRLV